MMKTFYKLVPFSSSDGEIDLCKSVKETMWFRSRDFMLLNYLDFFFNKI